MGYDVSCECDVVCWYVCGVCWCECGVGHECYDMNLMTYWYNSTCNVFCHIFSKVDCYVNVFLFVYPEYNRVTENTII